MQTPPKPIWFHGQMMLALYVGAAMAGYSDPINSIDLNITHGGDASPLISSGVNDMGQMLGLDYKPKPTEIEIAVNQSNLTLLAAALLGTGSTFSQDADTAVSVTVSLVNGEWVQLKDGSGNPIRHVSNVAITGKTLGTDFAVLPTMGMVKALNSGTAGPKSVTFDQAGLTGEKIIAGTEGSISFGVQMETKNHSTGEKGFLWIPKITVLPSEAAKLVNEARGDHKFKGFIIKLPSLPLYEFVPVAAAA